MRRSLLLLVAVTGCRSGGLSPPAEPIAEPEGFRSGTRLRAIYDTLDGVRVLRAWYDTERREECSFDGPAGWGRAHHCLPTVSRAPAGSEPAAAPEGGVSLPPWFADDACTVPLFLDPKPCQGQQYLSPPTANFCDEVPQLYLTGARFTGTKAWQRFGDGTCSGYGLPNSPPPLLYYAGATVPIDAFVAAHEEMVPVTDRMGVLTLVADDGSRQAIAAGDLARDDEPSRIWIADDNSRRWMPARWASLGPAPSGWYSDAACTSQLFASFGCPVSAEGEIVPKPGVTGVPPGTGLLRFRSLGAEVPASAAYQLDSSGACGPAHSPAVAPQLYAPGDPLPTMSFAEGSLVDVGAGPLRRTFDANQGQPLIDDVPGMVFTGGDHHPCLVLPTADGKRRCLPGAVHLVHEFVDAACTQPAVIAFTGPMLPQPPPPPTAPVVIDVYDRKGCLEDVARLYLLRPAVPAATLYWATEDTCTAVQFPNSWIYPLGAEQPTDGYPEAVETRD
jgi:hypothetical protein